MTAHQNRSQRSRSHSPFPPPNRTNSNLANGHDWMICHESAHAIVFRDHLTQSENILVQDEADDDDISEGKGSNNESSTKNTKGNNKHDTANNKSMRKSRSANELAPLFKSVKINLNGSNTNKLDDMATTEMEVEVEGFCLEIKPLPKLEFTKENCIQESHELLLLLENSDDADTNNPQDWTPEELQVYQALQHQRACVKTIERREWSSFLQRFLVPKQLHGRTSEKHRDKPPPENNSTHDNNKVWNSFVTSTSLLPRGGKKMRAYGSDPTYPVGVVFLLPQFESPQQEDIATQETETWAWPAGYAAKTEFNIDNRGRLINGRQEALVSLQQLRQYNNEYISQNNQHYIGHRYVQGFHTVPYNEVFVRVGGNSCPRSLEKGVGLFAALFTRSWTYNDMMHLFRTRARIGKILGRQHVANMPLLYIHPDHGVRILTRQLQLKIWKQLAIRVQPFGNPVWDTVLHYPCPHAASLDHRLQDLLPLLDDGIIIHNNKSGDGHNGNNETDNNKQSNNNNNNLLQILNHVELAHLAGGFGVTDKTFFTILLQQPTQGHVFEVMQYGFRYSIRSHDYHVARQMLMLYCLHHGNASGVDDASKVSSILQQKLEGTPAAIYTNLQLLQEKNARDKEINLPKPLVTKRLRRATNLKGLLVVFGAAQILKTITTTSALRRTKESYRAVEEWVHHGEDSIAFRVASWRDQRADEADANIAMSGDSQFFAFVTNKSVQNRKQFAQQLRHAAPEGDFQPVRFLQEIYAIVNQFHSPCMRLELLQFILGLDNRYSKELMKDSLELAAACLSLVT